MQKDSQLFCDIIHKICPVHTNPMLDLTPKMLKLIRIPKVWKTMCKGQLHWACFCHVMACQWKCISMSSRLWSQVPMSSELQGWAILLSQQTSHFVQYPTYYIVLQFPGLSITLNRADKAHCSSCLEPKRPLGSRKKLWSSPQALRKSCPCILAIRSRRVPESEIPFFYFLESHLLKPLQHSTKVLNKVERKIKVLKLWVL